MSGITLFIPVNQIIKNIVRFNKFNNINVFFLLIIVNILNQTVKLTILLCIGFPCLYRKTSLSLLFRKLQEPFFFPSPRTQSPDHKLISKPIFLELTPCYFSEEKVRTSSLYKVLPSSPALLESFPEDGLKVVGERKLRRKNCQVWDCLVYANECVVGVGTSKCKL